MDFKFCWAAALVSTCLLLSTVLGNEDASPDIYFLHIKSDIKYRFATTLVTSKVVNPDNISREVIFDVTLPNEAFMTNFTLEINNTIHIGEVKEKEAAKRQYQEAKNRGQSAGYIGTKPRETNKFNIKVNVEALQSVVFNLTYKEILRRKTGKYCHVIYIDPGQTVEDFQIEVAIQESRDITSLNVPPIRDDLLTNVIISDSATENVAEISRPTERTAYILYRPSVGEQTRSSETGLSGQFVVEYDVDREKDAGDLLVVNGYFVHFFAPEGIEPLPKDVLFILDKSSSMRGRKISQLITAMTNILDDMQEEDRFNIMTFNWGISYWIPGELIEANGDNINQAKRYVNKIIAAGSTNIDESMTEGIKLLSSQSTRERARVLIFLTDGEPTSGNTNLEGILSNVCRYNEMKIPIFTLAFGTGADYNFLKKMANQNDGFGRKIYEDSDAALQITGFYDEISTVLLKDVSFTYLDREVETDTLTNVKFNTYFKGSELIVAGRLSNARQQWGISSSILVDSIDGILNLTMPNEITTHTGFDLIKDGDFANISEQVWAYLTIKQKLKQKDASTNETEQEMLKQQILDMSLKYNFVTPLTSMVVTLDEESNTQPLDDVKPEGDIFRFGGSSQGTGYSSIQYTNLNQQPLPFLPRTGTSGNMHGMPGRLYKSPPNKYPIQTLRKQMGRRRNSLGKISITDHPTRTTTTPPRTTTPTATRPPRRHTPAGNSMFVVRVSGINEPLCMDDTTLSTGQRYKLFGSPYSDFTIYGHTKPNRAGTIRTKRRRRQRIYFDRVSATSSRHSMNFEVNSYEIDGVNHSWIDDWFSLSDFNSNITFPLVIHRSQSPGQLSWYADLSSPPRDITGIFGKFARMRGKVIKRKTKRGGKIIGKFKIRSANIVHKLKAKLINNPIHGVSSCWLLKKPRMFRP